VGEAGAGELARLVDNVECDEVFLDGGELGGDVQ
jgi:hypothetical protein